ncbi:site-specific DNA-methyltransferase [Peptococcaceae bacterium]|nr:site-specific DNA-methyltransferase [Peptococcaceae bacterium]MCL0041976.1 site-specific DNA-methyltransferase [Peptococcaceae bacterium]
MIKGSGTTLVEAKLLDRNAIGVDINLDAVMVARNRLNFSYLIGDTRKHKHYIPIAFRVMQVFL